MLNKKYRIQIRIPCFKYFVMSQNALNCDWGVYPRTRLLCDMHGHASCKRNVYYIHVLTIFHHSQNIRHILLMEENKKNLFRIFESIRNIIMQLLWLYIHVLGEVFIHSCKGLEALTSFQLHELRCKYLCLNIGLDFRQATTT